ncbi:MAG: hypothetical protein E3J90_02315 [Promethearchaeota archaeon]|nr:MAG: hypothetical protein E3J90_02315 [Candidatus Lokiarchaeota archaeon]
MKGKLLNSLLRYKKWLVIWIIFIILFCTTLIINAGIIGTINIYAILTHNFAIDTALIFLSIPIISIIAFIIGGYIFTPLFIFIHKKVLGRNLIYGIREMQRPKDFKGAFMNSLFPALLAVNLGILLSDESVLYDLLFVDSFQPGSAIYQILTLLILFPLVCGIGIGVFSAAYFLLESGIEYTNKEQKKVRRGAFPTEIRSIGGFYLYYFKGYAGISVVISLITLIISFFSVLEGLSIVTYIMNIFLWPLVPFIITFFMIPVFIIQDFTYERRKKYTLKWAEKFEIQGQLEDPLGLN